MSSAVSNIRIVFAASIAITALLALVVGISFAANDGPDDTDQLPTPDLTASVSSRTDGAVQMPRPGISGNIAALPEAVDLDGNGTEEVAFGTTSGFYIVGREGIELHIGPLAPVSEFTPINDISNDATDDVVVAVSDTQFPNIRAYDTVTGEEIWSFRPAQTTFANNLMWTSQQTLTFDLLADDLDNDGMQEVLATSGYRLYSLDAATGAPQWNYEWRDNLWHAASVADFTGDGERDVVVGSQDGYLIGVDGESGEEAWQMQIAQDYEAIDDRGESWKEIPQGVWDILPSASGERAVITSEDGFIRSVLIPGGKVEWELELITRADAALSRFYDQKNGKPTSPGDVHFLNLRAQFTPDVTGDGRDDLLASAYLGAERLDDPRQAALILLDGVTGRQLWRRQVADLATAGNVGVVKHANTQYVIVPGGDSVALTLADGTPASSKVLDSLGLLGRSNQDTGFSMVRLTSEGVVAFSDRGDVLWSEGESLRHIRRAASNRFLQSDLLGDSTPDVLVVSGSGQPSNFGIEPRARLLYVLDGATGVLSWEYEPTEELIEATGGLAGVTIGPDLNDDGKPEIIAYAQDPTEIQGGQNTGGEASRVIVLSGMDGTEILMAAAAKNTYYGIWEDIYLGGGSLTEMVKGELVRTRTMELERHWEEQERNNWINQYQSEMEGRWNEYVRSSLDEFSANSNAAGIGDDDRQAQMDADWGQYESDQLSNFENSLSAERGILDSLGVDPATIETYEARRREEFASALESEKDPTYERWQSEFDGSSLNLEGARNDFENELQGERERLEQEWLDEYVASLDSLKDSWIVENLGDIDNEIAQQLDQWTQDFEDQKQWRRIDKRILSVSPIKFPGTSGDYGLLVGTGHGISVLDLSGSVVWTKTTDPNVYSTPLGGTDIDKYGLGFGFDSNRPVRVISDVNGDGVDDLRFLDGRAMFIATSVISEGTINYVPGERILGPAGEDGNGDASEIDDVNGDGIKDVALSHWIENSPPQTQILSGVDGSKLMDLDGLDPNSTGLTPSSDFNGDGEPDIVLFERWAEGLEGPRLSILDSRSGDAIWVYTELNESQMLDNLRNSSEIMPVVAVGDLTGDGISEVALVRHLTWQPGGSVLVIDVTSGNVVKEIVTEAKEDDREQEERWHPGLLAAPVGDLNGDGVGELAIVNAFGHGPKSKQYRLAVIDLEAESVLADFRTIGSQLIPLEEAGLFALVGLSGEVYTLSADSELTITGPARTVDSSEPVTVSWSGAPEGSFNQVFVDQLEVARTNESSVELNLAAGEHSIMVRSIDPSGRGILSTNETSVTKSGSTFMLLYALTAGSLILILVLPGLRWWSRRSIGVGD